MNIHIRACTLDELGCLRQLSITTYRETFDVSNSEENMKAYLDDAFNLKKLQDELLNEHSSFYFLLVNDKVAGYMKLNVLSAQTDITDLDSIELERIYILAAYQGYGYGRMLLDKALSIGREYDKAYIWLGVWENNHKARSFYDKYHFYKIGQHTFVMGDDEQLDYVLRKDLYTNY